MKEPPIKALPAFVISQSSENLNGGQLSNIENHLFHLRTEAHSQATQNIYGLQTINENLEKNNLLILETNKLLNRLIWLQSHDIEDDGEEWKN